MGRRKIAHIVDQSFYTRQAEEKKSRDERRDRRDLVTSDKAPIPPSINSEQARPIQPTTPPPVRDEYLIHGSTTLKLETATQSTHPTGAPNTLPTSSSLKDELQRTMAEEHPAPSQPSRAPLPRFSKGKDTGGMRTPRRPYTPKRTSTYTRPTPNNFSWVKIGSLASTQEVAKIFAERLIDLNALNWKTADEISLLYLGTQLSRANRSIDLYQLALACNQLKINLDPNWAIRDSAQPTSKPVMSTDDDWKASGVNSEQMTTPKKSPNSHLGLEIISNRFEKPKYELTTIKGALRFLPPQPTLIGRYQNIGNQIGMGPSTIAINPLIFSMNCFKPGLG